MADGRGLETPVAKVMTSDVIWLREDTSLFAAATEMATAACRRMPILDAQARVVGVIALGDLLTVFAQQTDKLAKVIGTEIANPNVMT